MKPQSKFAKVAQTALLQERPHLLQFEAVGVADEDDYKAKSVALLNEKAARNEVQRANEKEGSVGKNVDSLQLK